MSSICIRKAKESDLPLIKKLITDLIDVLNDRKGVSINTALKNVKDLLNDNNSHILVAEVNGDVIGFINFTIRRTILHSAPSGLIDELVIAKTHRGKGIGRLLLQAAIKKCKGLGCCEVEVSTEFSNTNARKFYKEVGFEEKGVILEKDL